MPTKPQRLQHHTLPSGMLLQFKLERWHRRALYGLIAALYCSGMGWVIAHFKLRSIGQFGELIHPLEHWSMQVHGALQIPASFLLGALLFAHMRRAYRAGRNRSSGLCMIAVLLCLAVSGYGLAYLSREVSRSIWSYAHWLPGAALPMLLWIHINHGRASLAAD